MTAFDYVALDAAGRRRNGSISAPDEAAARQALKGRRLAPMRLVATAAAAEPVRTPLFGRLSARDQALVTRQLATLISVAPLEEALRTIAAQADRPRVRRSLNVIHAAVVEGYRLADAMGRPGAGFPPLYQAMVSAGESSGALPAVLERLADLLEAQQQVRAKVTTALVYPAVLAATAALVVIALMAFVVPKVVDQFDSMGQTLPLLTQVVIAISEAMRAFGWLALLALPVAGWLFALAMRRRAFRRAFHGMLLRLPVVGRLIRDVHAARLARTLSTMIASGLPVLEGLTLTTRTVGNLVLREAMEEMVAAIREGSGPSAAMRRAGIFPPILVYMAASGENSGRLDVMLARAADYLEREFNTFVSAALSLLEPAIIVVMGLIVAVIVLSILLPILQINSLALG